MNILIACEESQRVCTAFREKGHNAFSCDIQECSGGHPEWHIKDDVLPLINGKCYFTTCDGERYSISDKWDMILAFPPCTHLAVTGSQQFERKRQDGTQRQAIEFFCKILTADCDRICVENPVNIIGGQYVKRWFPDLCEKYGLPRKITQSIQPWYFGDNFQKTTCLWLKNLPPLVQEVQQKPKLEYKDWYDERLKKWKRETLWRYQIRCLPHKERGKMASKTFKGVARAMAEQWGDNNVC